MSRSNAEQPAVSAVVCTAKAVPYVPLSFGAGLKLVALTFSQYWGGGVACHDIGFPCPGNGDVALPFGSAPYVGLGLIVYSLLLFMEVFGSPFIRNT